MSMTLQNIYDTKEQAQKSIEGWRKAGFTARIKRTASGDYAVYVGSFGARYRKMRKLSRRPNMAIHIPERVLAWRERLRKSSIMRAKTFKKIKGKARRTGYRTPSAVAGKAYNVTLLSKYLESHPGDIGVRRLLSTLVKRRGKISKVRKNPSPKSVVIYDKLLGIEAQKGSGKFKGQHFRHDFKHKTDAMVLGNPDGSLTIKSTKGKRLWKKFNY